MKKLLATPVDELELSVRSSNCLKAANLRTLGELVIRTDQEMLKYRNFGKKSLQEIKEKLEEYGLSLGMKDKAHLVVGGESR
jgi:DNA-directed RNA polymerase subunit alpha